MSTKNLLVKSFMILRDIVTPVEACNCESTTRPTVCRHISAKYVCEFNAGEFTVGETIYVNCKFDSK